MSFSNNDDRSASWTTCENTRRFCPQKELQQFASDVSLWAKSEAFDWPQANRCRREHVGNSHQATNRPRDPIHLQQPPVSRSLCEGSKWSPLQSFKLEKMVAPNRSIWRPWAAELQVNWQIGKSCPFEKLLLLPASSAQQRCNARFCWFWTSLFISPSLIFTCRVGRHIRRISGFTCHWEKSKFLNYNFLNKWLLRRLAGHWWFLVINHNRRLGKKTLRFPNPPCGCALVFFVTWAAETMDTIRIMEKMWRHDWLHTNHKGVLKSWKIHDKCI